MANIAPMLGAIMGRQPAFKGEGKGRPKPKTRKGHSAGGTHKVTKGERSVSQPAQQHGELASYMIPKPLSHTQQIRANTKSTMKRATDDWVEGRITTQEHKAVHERGKHVLAGKHPNEFHGRSGERKIKGFR